ncbi:MAG TPA: winged helix-turn-helix domain-containing protein [Terriglobales bacterium]|nr:winged helix-turn-helix domain-containing protein [Terriglobales bacterium]
MAGTDKGIYRFGQFKVDLASGTLTRQGDRVKLQEQPFRILALLLERASEIVTREELRQALWAEDTYVEFDGSLNAALKRVRHALRDSPDNPIFIETVPRRGYRFIAPVDYSEPAAVAESGQRIVTVSSPAAELAAIAAPALAPFEEKRRRGTAARGIAAGVLLLAVLAMVFNLGGIRQKWIRSASPQIRPIASLAVLPLEDLSSDPAQQYFADGITDELITDLAQISNLKVISRTSTIQYRGTKKSIPEIGKALRADALIEGTVERDANRVRIRVQLIDSASDRHLWARSYDRELRDVLLLQSEAARDIAQEIRGQVSPVPSAAVATAPTPVNPEAYEAYLKGRYFLNKRSSEGMKTATGYFEQAIALDPRFALAYAGLADCYSLLGSGTMPASVASAKARTAALKALELDPSIAEGHTALAVVHFYYDWNWNDSERELQRAIQLNPNYATAHHWSSVYLSAMGRFPEAIQEAERAHELDPLSPSITISLATEYRDARRFDRSIELLSAVLELDPNFAAAHQGLGKTYAAMGLWKLAVDEFQKTVALSHDSDSLSGLAYAYSASGERAQALKIVAQLRAERAGDYVSPFNMAAVFTGLGEKDKAFSSLDRAYHERDSRLPFLAVDRWFEPLHSDPRFVELCGRMGLSAGNRSQ